MKHARNTRRGFTLLELTLVIALLGVLMAIVVTQVAGQGARAKTRLARSGLESVRSALEGYNIEFSSYPPETIVSPDFAAILTSYARTGSIPVTFPDYAPQQALDDFNCPL